MDWAELVPVELMSAAYRAGNEMAWNKQEALRVVQLLEKSGFEILGVEVWIPTKPGPTIPMPYFYAWTHREISSGRSLKSAADYIASFEWDSRDETFRNAEPFFNICADQKKTFE